MVSLTNNINSQVTIFCMYMYRILCSYTKAGEKRRFISGPVRFKHGLLGGQLYCKMTITINLVNIHHKTTLMILENMMLAIHAEPPNFFLTFYIPSSWNANIWKSMFCSELWYTAFCCQRFTFTSVSVYVFIHTCITYMCMYRQSLQIHIHI